MVLSGDYDPFLVALSVAVASLASYAALDLGGRIRASQGWPRLACLSTAALALGGGIWSMHFIAMLAFLLPIPVDYAVGSTVLSLIVAIAVTAIGFYVIGTRQASRMQFVLAGTFVGIGIVGMHYTGMDAMRMQCRLDYAPLLVALSIIIAIGAATAALWLAFRTSSVWQSLLAALVMGTAISGMHYTGMAAAVFTRDAPLEAVADAGGVTHLNLALSVAGITFLILILALIASAFDRQFALLAERETVLLRESEDELRRVYRGTPLPLHALGPQGTVENVSDTWLDLLGYGREAVLGRRFVEFMTPASRRRYEDVDWPKLQRGEDIREAEYQMVCAAGDVLDVLMSARLDRLPTGRMHIVGGLIDVTARKRAEDALRQAQRMEAIGQLTGGVAHDFNNLLMVISGAAEKFRRTVADAALARPLDMIGLAVKRGQSLTGHLLSFARRQTLETNVVDLSEGFSALADMLRRSLRGDIDVRVSVAGGSCRVRIDPGELELALLNLGVNARDAMPDGGILSLSLRCASLQGDAAVEGLCGDFAVIELADTGVGIAPEVLPRIFDPFFTTKPVGKGTGLGLSQVYGFAKQSGGAVLVDSKPGQGTRVSLYLPVTTEAVSAAKVDQRAVGDVAAKRGAVLLVEDNQEVAAVAADYFTQLGYAVDTASNGAEALRKLQKRQRNYDLVFSDILMPGSVAGLEIARIVRDYHPDTAVLLTTGYSEKAQAAVREGFSIVQKPYDLARLQAALAATPAKSAAPVAAAAAS